MLKKLGPRNLITCLSCLFLHQLQSSDCFICTKLRVYTIPKFCRGRFRLLPDKHKESNTSAGSCSQSYSINGFIQQNFSDFIPLQFLTFQHAWQSCTGSQSQGRKNLQDIDLILVKPISLDRSLTLEWYPKLYCREKLQYLESRVYSSIVSEKNSCALRQRRNVKAFKKNVWWSFLKFRRWASFKIESSLGLIGWEENVNMAIRKFKNDSHTWELKIHTLSTLLPKIFQKDRFLNLPKS